MCRIFAVRSKDPWPVAPAFEQLRKLSVQHKDGWGVVQFDEDCAAHASEHFEKLTRNLRSRNRVLFLPILVFPWRAPMSVSAAD